MRAKYHFGARPYSNFQCEQCPRRFWSLKNFNKHLKSHHGNQAPGKRSFQCVHCPKRFPLKSNLNQHAVKKHPGKWFECPKCRGQFALKKDLKRHLPIHATIKPLESDICHEIPYSQELELPVQRWFQTPKRKRKRHECSVCHKTFSRSDYLKAHQFCHVAVQTSTRETENSPRTNVKDSKRAKHECFVCFELFPINSHLRYHLFEHLESNETTSREDPNHDPTKTFKCQVCQEEFVSVLSCYLHTIAHSRTKPFKCKMCPQDFTLPSNLYRHAAYHRAEGAFRCQPCVRNYCSEEELKRHKCVVTRVPLDRELFTSLFDKTRDRLRLESDSEDESTVVDNVTNIDPQSKEASPTISTILTVNQSDDIIQHGMDAQSVDIFEATHKLSNKDKRTNYPCELSKDDPVDESSLRQHFTFHPDEKDLSSVTLRNTKGKRHVKATGDKVNVSKHNCSCCLQSFKTEAKLEKHCKKLHFFCYKCTSVFRTLFTLKIHTKQKHEVDQGFINDEEYFGPYPLEKETYPFIQEAYSLLPYDINTLIKQEPSYDYWKDVSPATSTQVQDGSNTMYACKIQQEQIERHEGNFSLRCGGSCGTTWDENLKLIFVYTTVHDNLQLKVPASVYLRAFKELRVTVVDVFTCVKTEQNN